MKGSETMKNEKQQKQSEKLTENKPPIEPSQSQTQCDDCSSGKDFAFFWYRFMRVL
jgi:hypothetical protein